VEWQLLEHVGHDETTPSPKMLEDAETDRQFSGDLLL